MQLCTTFSRKMYLSRSIDWINVFSVQFFSSRAINIEFLSMFEKLAKYTAARFSNVCL